ncbi:FAD-binding oxidoreductase [Azohydromonas caseinilytica]|uniref:2Fe-2S iron-sulfur cluster binding domain-containing protein n=1 Tax=Azohydromonas caseinilytica TaxID=2728836 RepID=A0A848F9F6_9BURK|nr:FAD-binding oxidoreductase [Azohydromonas caseinilytica]NML14870.1 2Fe-2S iron-sulfur cluster binding domain-containing protein [Azohydromonas caseinilytica]
MSSATVTLANLRQFTARRGQALLDAALEQGLVLEHGCRTGRCGGCKAQVRSGDTAALREEVSLPPAQAAQGWILTCAREAVTDVALDIEDLGALAGIEVKTVPCRIDALQPLAPDVMRIELRLPPNAAFRFLPGQYIDVSGPGGLRRSYSIASDSAQPGRLTLHVRAVPGGAMSRYWFHEAKPNDLLRLRGPLGSFFVRECAGQDLVFLATGTGIAPVLSMLAGVRRLDAAQRPRSLALYWGGRLAQDLYLDIAALAPEVRFVPVLSRQERWDGARGHVQDVFLAAGPDLARSAVYACGSAAMTAAARDTLLAAGLAPGRFHADAFVSSSL